MSDQILTLLGGSTNRFVLEDGTEGLLRVKNPSKGTKKDSPRELVFVPDVPADDEDAD